MEKYLKQIYKYITRGLAIVLCVFVTFPLFGCVERAPTVQNGLVVTPSIREPYSTETEEYAQEVLYDLLAQYFRKTVMQILPETIMQKLRAQAVNIQKCILNSFSMIHFVHAINEIC